MILNNHREGSTGQIHNPPVDKFIKKTGDGGKINMGTRQRGRDSHDPTPRQYRFAQAHGLDPDTMGGVRELDKAIGATIREKTNKRVRGEVVDFLRDNDVSVGKVIEYEFADGKWVRCEIDELDAVKGEAVISPIEKGIVNFSRKKIKIVNNPFIKFRQ